VRLQFRKPALRVGGKAFDQRLADQKSEHRVSEEFHLLVIGLGARGLRRLDFVNAGAVSQRADKKLPILKVMT
jgi:hypothetical protein